MKVKLLRNIFFGLYLFMLPIVANASNEKLTINCVVDKNSYNFNVAFFDMTLSNDIEYQWSVVKTKAAEVSNWNDVVDWDESRLSIYLDNENKDFSLFLSIMIKHIL